MRCLIFTLFGLTPYVTYAQVQIHSIKETNPKFKNRNNEFPSIAIGNNKDAAKKINDDLLKDMLELEEQMDMRKGIFANVNPDSDHYHPTLSDISYEILCNEGRLLSIAISADACNAYCEFFTNYYTYDTRSGNRLSIDVLIKPETMQILIDSVNASKKKRLAYQIRAIEDTTQKKLPWASTGDSTYYSDMLALYKECIEREYADLKYVRFYLNKKELYIELDRCSAHANRNIDELDAFKFYFNVKNWTPYFTDYGRMLLQSE
jgi:hypothetical protein